jgi:hypothetical protein
VSDKPSYLGLLNAISLAESNAHCYLTAWKEKTPSADVRRVLEIVATREGEHGLAFQKRINELGYSLIPKEDPGFEDRMAIAAADCSDLEKFEALGFAKLVNDIAGGTDDKPDFLLGLMKDTTIDIQTGELLGRYIAEERDTGRLLKDCYQQLKAAANGGASAPRLDSVEAKIDQLCEAVTQLTELVAAASNGKSKAKTRV